MQFGNFEFTETEIKDVYLIQPRVFGDARGYFSETYVKRDFDAAGLCYDFVQDNRSSSRRGVLRGLHFQKTPPQAKLVRALRGEVFDVAVDMRPGSATYGKWVGATLSGENRTMIMIPRGFAHGFLVLSDEAEFAYKCDDYYHPEDEAGIAYNDPTIAIAWPDAGELTLSEKDRHHPQLPSFS